MRVAYVSADPGVPVFGSKGCSVHVQEIVRAFLRRGDEVLLVAARTGGVRPPGMRSVPVVELPAPSVDDPGQRELALLDGNARLASQLRASGPFDLIYERHSLWSFAAMQFARDGRIPGILEVNAPLIEEQAKYRTLVYRQAAIATSRDAFRNADALIAVSDGVAGYLRQFPIAGNRIHVIPNGVDPQRFAMVDAAERHDSEFVVGFVGTLKAWHGVDLLIDAFAQLHQARPQSRLVVIGDGPMRSQLQQQVQALPTETADAIRFTGTVTPDDIPQQLEGIDAAVAPYPLIPDFYFSPLKLLEYMAAGRAVISSRIGQVENLITDRETGLLCEAGNVDELARLLLELHNDADLRRRLGAAARRCIAKSHTWGGVLQRILQTVDVGSPADREVSREVP